MIKKLICVECPRSCALSADIENCRVKKVIGNECPKGEKYAISETENPQRILTATVLTEGISLKMMPVRTDKPIPKQKILEAAKEIRKITVKQPLKPGDIVINNFLNLGVNLIATRGDVL